MRSKPSGPSISNVRKLLRESGKQHRKIAPPESTSTWLLEKIARGGGPSAEAAQTELARRASGESEYANRLDEAAPAPKATPVSKETQAKIDRIAWS